MGEIREICEKDRIIKNPNTVVSYHPAYPWRDKKKLGQEILFLCGRLAADPAGCRRKRPVVRSPR